jgi:Flp pilus assembly protein TadG
MKPNFFSTERGQALIIIALAAVGLFAMMGLAIDGTAKLSDRRNAQNAADTAALTSALALVNDDDLWYLNALDRAYDNGYTDDQVRSEVWTFTCDTDVTARGGAPLDCGTAYEGDPNYVAVVIRSHVPTTFARVLGFAEFQNVVSAVTYWNKRGPAYDGNLIVALNPYACTGGGANGNIALGTAGGSKSEASITLTGGGAFVNSGGTGCGMEIMGCPTITVSTGELGSTGNGNINMDVGSATCQQKLTLPTPKYNQSAYPFPPEMPDEPNICSTSQPAAPVNNSTLAPGYYSEFPPSKGSYKNMEDDITLQPGIYCLDTDLSLTNGHSITGSNVLIYLKDGNEFSIQGGTLSLSGRTEGDYGGYVLIGASDFTGQVPKCDINGNATATFTGTISNGDLGENEKAFLDEIFNYAANSYGAMRGIF